MQNLMFQINEMNFISNRERLYQIIKNALNTNYYCTLINDMDVDILSHFTYENFCKLPVTTKDIYNKNRFSMIHKRYKLDEIYYLNLENDMSAKREYLYEKGFLLKATSGSTGNPLEIIKSIRENTSDYMYLNRARHKLTDYNFKGAFLWIWPANPITRKIIYAHDQVETIIRINEFGYQYMLYEHSEYHFQNICSYIIDHRIEWITTSPSILYSLAEYMQDTNTALPGIRYLECQSEHLHTWQKEKIESVFGITPFSIYSSNEIQFIAAKCDHMKMHLLQQKCFLEFLDTGEHGKKICVTALNYNDLPMIRYQLGDCGDWDREQKCQCQLKELPSFSLNQYRSNDFIITKTGVKIEPFIITDSILFVNNIYHLDILQYKVKQVACDRFEYILANEVQPNVIPEIKRYLQRYLSHLMNYAIDVSVISNCKRAFISTNKKFKYFINEVQ